MGLTPPAAQDIVVVGASGDLAARKLLPALYNVSVAGLLPTRGDIVGVAPVPWDDAAFRAHAADAIRQYSRTGFDAAGFASFAARLRFVELPGSGDLTGLRQASQCDRRLIYLAVPPSAFTGLIGAIGRDGLAEGTSIIIEKPFGHDRASAAALNAALHAVVPEERVFRIDHYLGKETVQNLLVFRFGNSLFERVWNRDAIARVEITVAESLGVEHRGAFYEETGAIRDIVQNHMFQLLSVIAMEPPVSFDAEALRNEKVKVLQAVHPIAPEQVVRGQYAAGMIDGKPVPGYRQEPGVAVDSRTATYAALRVDIDNWRWSGVPFLLRTGKRLRARDTRVVVSFRDVPLHLFASGGMRDVPGTHLIVRIQPQEGISLSFVAKRPGPDLSTQPVGMDFDYGKAFKTTPLEAYERLLHDALDGDHTLFIREDEVERGWAIVAQILDNSLPLVGYPAGGWGPAEANRLALPGEWHSMNDREDTL